MSKALLWGLGGVGAFLALRAYRDSKVREVIEDKLKVSYDGPACPPQGTKLLFVGDSYAEGLKPYIMAKAQGCGIAWAQDTKVGSNITYWSERIWGLVASFQPTHVLFSQGGNDFGRNDPDKVQADIASFVEKIRESDAIPMLIEPPTTPFPDPNNVRSMWGSVLKFTLASGFIIDSQDLEIPRVQGDSLGHPTQAGYQKWAEWIWPWFTDRAGRSGFFSGAEQAR